MKSTEGLQTAHAGGSARMCYTAMHKQISFMIICFRQSEQNPTVWSLVCITPLSTKTLLLKHLHRRPPQKIPRRIRIKVICGLRSSVPLIMKCHVIIPRSWMWGYIWINPWRLFCMIGCWLTINCDQIVKRMLLHLDSVAQKHRMELSSNTELTIPMSRAETDTAVSTVGSRHILSLNEMFQLK